MVHVCMDLGILETRRVSVESAKANPLTVVLHSASQTPTAGTVDFGELLNLSKNYKKGPIVALILLTPGYSVILRS